MKTFVGNLYLKRISSFIWGHAMALHACKVELRYPCPVITFVCGHFADSSLNIIGICELCVYEANCVIRISETTFNISGCNPDK